MKKNFLTGLIILLPIVLTLWITMFIVNLLTKPFQGIILHFVDEHQLHFMGSPTLIIVLSKILILMALAALLVLIGMIAQWMVVHYFFKLSDSVLHRIPVVNKIYKSIQDVMKNLFKTDNSSFSQVVLVPFPKTKTWCVGLVTSANAAEGSDKDHLDLMTVFVPAPPNPTMGFVLLYKRDQVVFTNMRVEDAIRFVVSCGVMYNGFVQQR